MAGQKVNRTVKVKGSSIMEVIVAMLVILIVFGLSMTIFSNVTRMSSALKQIRARAILSDLQQKAETTVPVTQTLSIDQWKIEQILKPYPADGALNELDLTIYDANGEKVAELQKLLIAGK